MNEPSIIPELFNSYFIISRIRIKQDESEDVLKDAFLKLYMDDFCWSFNMVGTFFKSYEDAKKIVDKFKTLDGFKIGSRACMDHFPNIYAACIIESLGIISINGKTNYEYLLLEHKKLINKEV